MLVLCFVFLFCRPNETVVQHKHDNSMIPWCRAVRGSPALGALRGSAHQQTRMYRAPASAFNHCVDLVRCVPLAFSRTSREMPPGRIPVPQAA